VLVAVMTGKEECIPCSQSPNCLGFFKGLVVGDLSSFGAINLCSARDSQTDNRAQRVCRGAIRHDISQNLRLIGSGLFPQL